CCYVYVRLRKLGTIQVLVHIQVKVLALTLGDLTTITDGIDSLLQLLATVQRDTVIESLDCPPCGVKHPAMKVRVGNPSVGQRPVLHTVYLRTERSDLSIQLTTLV